MTRNCCQFATSAPIHSNCRTRMVVFARWERWGGEFRSQNSEVRSTPRGERRVKIREEAFARRPTSSIREVAGVETQESGVAEYASKVFIRKSRTSISLGKSSPSSQIL